jgi:hypothetical protein
VTDPGPGAKLTIMIPNLLPDIRRMGRADLEAELRDRRAVPDLRQHRTPCLFPRGCAICDPLFECEECGALEGHAADCGTKKAKDQCVLCKGAILPNEPRVECGDGSGTSEDYCPNNPPCPLCAKYGVTHRSEGSA